MIRFLCLWLVVFSVSLQAAKIFQHQVPGVFIVDDFRDANFNYAPKWWTFADIEPTVEENNLSELPGLGYYSLKLTGDPGKWFVGGVGTYFGLDVEPYNAIKILVRGSGTKSGTLVFELFDDDNDNWEIEPHPEYKSQTEYDDKFIYTQKVDWVGWKVLIIQLKDFVDVNTGIGDDTWNPYHSNGSGGLLQMQMIVMAADKLVKPDIRIDAIKFFNYVPPKPKPKYDSGDDW